MAIDANHDQHAQAQERRVFWFRGGERPVSGGGNTVFVRPEGEQTDKAPLPTVAGELQ